MYYNNKMFKTFHLIENSKNPTDEWKYKTFKYNVTGQLGVPCGKLNNITVVDLDLYKDEAGEFVANFPEFQKLTKCIETPRNGFHLYFKYVEGFRNRGYGEYIDVKTQGGYVVGEGSQLNGVKYKAVNDMEPQEMPEELKQYLFNLVPSTTTKRRDNPSMFNYDTDDETFKCMCDKLNNSTWTNYNSWRKFTTACRAFGKYDIWDTYNKKHPDNYNEEINIKCWGNVDPQYIETAIIETFNKDYDAKVMKIKPIIQNCESPNIVIDRKYIQDKKQPSVYSNGYETTLMQSDTGTGKTYSFIYYLKETNDKFISITNRIELGRDQYTNISKAGIDCKFYEYENKFLASDSIVIQLDSIAKIPFKDFSNHVLFLDEIDALLCYLVLSSTLDKTVCKIFKRLCGMIKSCKKLICVDKNISDMVMSFITAVRCGGVCFVTNDYKKWEGQEVVEWTDEKALYEEIKTKDKYLIITDEYRQLTKADEILKDPEVYYVSKFTKNPDHIDTHDKAGFNPKIVQGIDLQTKRDIYAIYNTTTITADEMYQQMTRCRNPTAINLLFLQNRCMFDDIDKAELEKLQMASETEAMIDFSHDATDEEYKLFIKTYCHYKYNKIAFQSNPKQHLYMMLRKAGFKIITSDEKVKRAITDKELSIINTEKHIVAVDNKEDDTMSRKAYEQINELLKLPADVAKEYPELFTKNSRLQQHFNICKYAQVETQELKHRVHTKDSFKILKLRSNENKINTFKEMQKAFTCEATLDNITIPANADALYLTYKNVIGSRSKKAYDFHAPEDVRDCLVGVGGLLFGTAFYMKVGKTSTEETIKGKRKQKIKNIYDYNAEYIKTNTDLSKYRHGDMQDKEGKKKPIYDYCKDLDRV
jgi:hypothetical protein